MEYTLFKRLIIKIPFINKGIEFIDLHSIFKDNSVISSIPNYFNNSETPIICYKYNKPIRSTIFSTIRLSPLGSPIIRKYTKPFNAFKRRGMYPNVSKCNAKRCVCCTHLCTKTTITSSVNGRKFSVINNNDLD